MRVLHVNAFDAGGGAARAAVRLVHAVRRQGIDAELLVQVRRTADPQVLGPATLRGRLAGRLAPWVDGWAVRRAAPRRAGPFSPASRPEALARRVAALAPDVVHLHWVGFGMLRVETLAALGLPIVWTLHDAWAFTGGCHVPFDAGAGRSCDRYREACGRCPVLGSCREDDLSRRVWSRKREAWAGLDLTVVAPSRWLADCARASSLLGGRRVEVVPNGLELERFATHDQAQARRQLGIAPGRRVVVTGAHGTAEPNKGFHLLDAALRALRASEPGRPLELVVFGSPPPRSAAPPPCPTRYLGWLPDDAAIHRAYAAADVAVVPSLLENLPFAAMEALASGTPVVAFRQGGMPDLVTHREDGWLAEPYDPGDLARGIAWALDAPPAPLRAAARLKAVRCFDADAVARRYVSLYQAAAAGRAARLGPPAPRPASPAAPSAPAVSAPERRPLAGNALWRLVAVVVRVGVGVVSVSWFTRLLGMSQWGLLAIFQAALAPLALFEGLGTAAIKYASEALGRRDRDAATAAVQTTVVLNLALGAAGVLALGAGARWLATSLFTIAPEDVARAVWGFRLVGLAWFFTVLSAAYGAVFAAHQRYDLVARLGVATFLVSTGAGLAAAAATRSIVAVLLAQGAAAALMTGVNAWRAARLLPGLAARPRLDRASLRRSGRFWSWQVVGALGGLATAWADRYVLAAYFVPAVVGFHAVANVLQTQVYLTFLEMGDVLFPAVSDLEGRGELPAARRLALLVGWALTTGFGVCAAVLAVVGGDFIQLWISPEAALATTQMLRTLCLAGLAGMAALAPFQYVLGVGETRWNAASGTVAAVIVIALDFALVPRHGLQGIGYGLLAAGVARWGFVALIWRAHFRGDFTLAAFAGHVFSPPLLSAVALALGVAAHDRLAHPVTWGWLAVETAVALAAVAGAQFAASELLPGGALRRREITAALRPLLARARALLPAP